MPDSEAPATTLSLITVSTEGAPAAGASEIREAGRRIEALKTLLVDRKNVKLSKIDAELTRVQGEIDGVLAKVDRGARQGFSLAEVEISLGVSAEGSIGVVTAGIDAGITLHFVKA